ncbi:Mobile element protein [Azospirillum largimobile]
MRRHGIRGAAARRFRPVTTDSRHGLPVAPDLLGQAFQVAEPNRVWLADETYYNRQRAHSAIGYNTPEQAELRSA